MYHTYNLSYMWNFKKTQVYRYREHIGGGRGWEKWVSMVTIVNNCIVYLKVAKRSSKLSCQEKKIFNYV